MPSTVLDIKPDINDVKRVAIMSVTNYHKKNSIKSESVKFYDRGGTITVLGER